MDNNPTRLLIKDLPDCNPHYLKTLFEKEGKARVVDVKIGKDGRSAILRYAKAEDLNRLLLKLPIKVKGKKVDVGIFYPSAVNSRTRSKILVHGVDKNMHEELLQLYFENKTRSGGGEVTDVKVDYHTGDAVITFAEMADAWRVAYHTPHILNQKEIHCQYIPESKAGEGLSVQIITRPSIKHADEKTRCDIQDCCQLDDGSLLMVDFNHKSVKLFSHIDYKMMDRLKLPVFPTSICTTGTANAAVGTFEGIYLISVQDNKLSQRVKSLKKDHDCLGLAYYGGELFVNDRKVHAVFVYTLRGAQLRRLSVSSTDSYYHIAACESKLFITHETQGLVTMDKDGQNQLPLSNGRLRCAHGVCVGGGGRVFVTGWESHNVFQMNAAGTQFLRVVGTEASGLWYPRSVCFDKINTALVVTCKDQDFVTVFHLSD